MIYYPRVRRLEHHLIELNCELFLLTPPSQTFHSFLPLKLYITGSSFKNFLLHTFYLSIFLKKYFFSCCPFKTSFSLFLFPPSLFFFPPLPPSLSPSLPHPVPSYSILPYPTLPTFLFTFYLLAHFLSFSFLLFFFITHYF